MKKECKYSSLSIIWIAFSLILLLCSTTHLRFMSRGTLIGIWTVTTWAVAVTGIFIYFTDAEWSKKKVSEDKHLQEDVRNWKDEKYYQLFELQYEQISNGVRSRDNVTVITGSIFITISLILLGTLLELQCTQSIDFRTEALLIGAIMVIYSIWFICIDLTSVRLNSLQYQRLVKMEETKKFRHHRFTRDQVGDDKWLNYVRRRTWLYSFYVLTAISIVILTLP